MSSYSPDLRIELISTGDQAGTWGNTTNTNLGTIIESAIAGYDTVAVTSAAQAFTVVNGAADQARLAMIRLTTTTAASFSVYAPPVSKQYIIWNNSGQTATIYNWSTLSPITAAGTGITIANGEKLTVFSDGTNFYGTDVSGVAGTAHGGTGLTTYTVNGVLYAPSASTLANSSNFVFDGTNVGIGASTPSTYGKFVVGGTGSFTSSLVSTSTTLADKPTLEFRKTATGTTSGVTNNQIGRISFYSQSGNSGTTTTESAYITAKEYRVGTIGQSELKLATYVSSVSVETNSVTLSTNGLDLYAGGTNGISYTGDQHVFTGPAFFNDQVDCVSLDVTGAANVGGALTVATVPVVTTTGSQTLTNKTLGSGLVMGASALTFGTLIGTTSGTVADFTSIPSWVRRITIVFCEVSTNGTSPVMVQLGIASGVVNSGYSGVSTVLGTGGTVTTSNITGFFTLPSATYATSSDLLSGSVTLTKQLSGGNVWVINGLLSNPPASYAMTMAGFRGLPSVLTFVRITTANGTDTFDNGSVNILYE
jgi:hypothetical protein